MATTTLYPSALTPEELEGQIGLVRRLPRRALLAWAQRVEDAGDRARAERIRANNT